MTASDSDLKHHFQRLHKEIIASPKPTEIIERLREKNVFGKVATVYQLKTIDNSTKQWEKLLQTLENSSHQAAFQQLYQAMRDIGCYADIIRLIDQSATISHKPAKRTPILRGHIRKPIDILLIGETGKGKSTWINAFANYCMYSSLQEALDKGGCFPIPARCCVRDRSTGVTRLIGTHEGMTGDASEWGYAVTIQPQEYRFVHDTVTISLIDTPGLLDVRKSDVEENPDMDKEHLKNIVKMLSTLTKLDAVFVFIKASDTRLNDNIKYCLTQLFGCFHADVCQNVIFILTFAGSSRNVNNSRLMLENFIQSKKLRIKIPLPQESLYRFENDSVQYLIEHKHGIIHSDEDGEFANLNWKRSVANCQSLLLHIKSLKPHRIVRSTLSIHDAHNISEILTEVVLRETECIFADMRHIKDKRASLRPLLLQKQLYENSDIKELMTVKETQVVVIPLGHWNVVCESEKCVSYFEGKMIPKRCCDHCSSRFMYFCDKMDFWGKCKSCKCHTSHHKWMTEDIQLVTEEKLDKSVMDEMLKIKDSARQIEFVVDQLEEKLRTRISEKDRLLNICAKLSMYTQQNTLVGTSSAWAKTSTGNDLILSRLENNIKNLTKAVEDGADEAARIRLEELQKIKSEYKQHVQCVVKSTDSKKANIDDILSELYKLPISGKALEHGVRAAELAKIRAKKYMKQHRSATRLPAECQVLQLQALSEDTSKQEQGAAVFTNL